MHNSARISQFFLSFVVGSNRFEASEQPRSCLRSYVFGVPALVINDSCSFIKRSKLSLRTPHPNDNLLQSFLDCLTRVVPSNMIIYSSPVQWNYTWTRIGVNRSKDIDRTTYHDQVQRWRESREDSEEVHSLVIWLGANKRALGLTICCRWK